MIKKFFCWMKWHSFGYVDIHHHSNALITHAKCKWCSFEGQVDSQGNLF